MSSISAARVVRSILLDSAVASKVNKIYPVVVDKADKPYIVFRRVSMIPARAKNVIVEDSATIQILVVTDDYDSGLEIAEEVRKALDCRNLSQYGVSECILTNAQETWMDDAYVQDLYFTIKM